MRAAHRVVATDTVMEGLMGDHVADGRAGSLVDLEMVSRLAASITLFSVYSDHQ